MEFVTAVLINILAFALLAVSMRKHYTQVFSRQITPFQLRGLRAGGWIALALTLAWLVLASESPGVALVLFAASLTIAGWVVALVLAFGFRRISA